MELLQVKRPALMSADEQQVCWQEQSELCPGLPGYLLGPPGIQYTTTIPQQSAS